MLNQGALLILVSPQGKHYLRKLDIEADLHTQEGVIHMKDVAEAGFGGSAYTHLGHPFRILRPTTYDLVKGVKRSTQIMYPKEIGYTLMKLGVSPGSRVIESGSGSGGLTLALANAVGDEGRVYTFERRQDFYELSGKNLEAAGLEHRVSRFRRDVIDGFMPDEAVPGDVKTDPSGAHALFLDVRTPWEYLEQAARIIEPGAPVGFLLPTTNQVSDLLGAFEAAPFEDVEILEILIRRYKNNAERLRPEDRMVAHTGFLVFARHAGLPLSEWVPPPPKPPRPDQPGTPEAAPTDDSGHAPEASPP
jgi:tRNA (adenine57-N1/adenine58-N1)-methyltransferase catalytic subunit